ncbi:MAG TPA: LytTR family DNA-binding domain-containing protein [Candidatus Acidoferrales bacterium]|nr:LytTR family DNA-binding domain-containing protein [Candidatus Acidoferrales bacterium]
MSRANELDVERYATVTTKSQTNHSNHALATMAGRDGHGAMAEIIELPSERRDASNWQVPRIAIKHKRKVLFIDPNDVFSVVAQGNYVILEGKSGSYRLLESISIIAEKLRPYGFIRIHRSRVVNCGWVEGFSSCPDGSCLLRLRGGREYAVTKSYKQNLKVLAGVWLGNNETEKC